MLDLRSQYERSDMKPDRKESLTLELLAAIDEKSDLTQRHLADRMGIALGLTNSYLRRCVRKGLVKITQAPANRFLYYLTPQGFAEKSRLTAEFLTSSLAFYRRASGSLDEAFAQCREKGAQRVLFGGISELTEIGCIRAVDFAFEIVGAFDPASRLNRIIGRPVWRNLDEASASDVAVITAFTAADQMYDALCANFGASRVVVPDILDVFASRSGN